MVSKILLNDVVLQNNLETESGKKIEIWDIHSQMDRFEDLKKNLNAFEEREDIITIFNWSALSDFSAIKHGYLPYLKLFNEKFNLNSGQRDNLDLDSKKCFNPIFDEDGQLIADFAGNIIVFTFDAFHVQTEAVNMLLIYVFEKSNQINRLQSLAIRKNLFSFLGKLTENYNSWKFRRRGDLNNQISNLERSIQNYWNEIKRFRENEKELKIELAGMSGIKLVSTSDIRSIIKKLKTFSFVKSIKIYKHQMTVSFKDLNLFDRNLGEYRLILDSGLNYWILNKFLKDRKTSANNLLVQHPQVNHNEFLCGGNLNPRELLCNGQIDVFVQAIWELLNNYNPSDCSINGGMFITVWDYLHKYPKKTIPDWFYEEHDDEYWEPVVLEKIFNKRNKEGSVDQFAFPHKSNFSGVDE